MKLDKTVALNKIMIKLRADLRAGIITKAEYKEKLFKALRK